jgi:hypothetical protein
MYFTNCLTQTIAEIFLRYLKIKFENKMQAHCILQCVLVDDYRTLYSTPEGGTDDVNSLALRQNPSKSMKKSAKFMEELIGAIKI